MAFGDRWRILAHYRTAKQRKGKEYPFTFEAQDEGGFDELVVDDWLHIEQMDNAVWWMRLHTKGARDVVIWVRLHKDRPHEVTINDDSGWGATADSPDTVTNRLRETVEATK